jgi:hypothetical protein
MNTSWASATPDTENVTDSRQSERPVMTVQCPGTLTQHRHHLSEVPSHEEGTGVTSHCDSSVTPIVNPADRKKRIQLMITLTGGHPNCPPLQGNINLPHGLMTSVSCFAILPSLS